ncbi:MAG: IS1595 family transposase [Thermaerobacter sp.]|nr:IS1595 family transposase [Thermaerobacter sp.]
MALVEWQVKFRRVNDCRAFLVQQRWPQGFVCPACGHRKAWVIHRHDRPWTDLYECEGCRRQISVTAGTVFHRSKIPLETWFQAIALIGEADLMRSSYRLGEALGISAPSAQLIRGKIRRAMADERVRAQFDQIQQWVAQNEPSATAPLPRGYSIIIRSWASRQSQGRWGRKKILPVRKMRAVRTQHIGFEWTPHSVLLALQRAHRQSGYYTITRWRHEKKKPTATTILQLLGSWHQAWKAAGVDVRRLSPDQVIAALQAIGHYVPEDDWSHERRSPNVKTIRRIFGSYKAAWTMAGFSPQQRSQQTRAQILQTLREAGRYYTCQEWIQAGKHPVVGTIQKYFGSWRVAWQTAGIPTEGLPKRGRPPRAH